MEWCCTVDWYNIIVDVVCALIGGGLTLGGVCLTIKAQRESEDKIRIQNARPYLYSADEKFPATQPGISLTPISKDCIDGSVRGIIKNTDNGLCIIKKIVSEKTEYFPSGTKLIDKNAVVEVAVRLENKVETLRNWKLFVEDIYENEYCYEITVTGTHFTLQ